MRMRVWMLPLLAAAVIAGAAAAGHAVPSLGGPTGVVSVPTAAVAPTTDLQASVTYRALAIPETEPPADLKIWSIQALRGVSDEAELWAAYQRLHNTADSQIWEFGGKIQMDQSLVKDSKMAVGVSLGRWMDGFGIPDVSPAVTDVDILKGYLVFSKDLTPGATPSWEWGPTPGIQAIGSAGILYLRASPDDDEDQTLCRPFAALEMAIGKGLNLGLEYRWQHSDLDEKAVFSAVVRRTIGEDLWMQLGTSNASPLGLGVEDQDIFIQVAYDIPMTTGY